MNIIEAYKEAYKKEMQYVTLVRSADEEILVILVRSTMFPEGSITLNWEELTSDCWKPIERLTEL